jgi:hypothetical protein
MLNLYSQSYRTQEHRCGDEIVLFFHSVKVVVIA